MSDLDSRYLSAIQQVSRMEDDTRWKELTGGGEDAPKKGEDDPGFVEKFLGGVTKGMRGVPNVFRPPTEGDKDIIGRVGEAVSLPFTIPWEGLMQGLQDAGLVSASARKNLTDSLMGATPALTHPSVTGARNIKEGVKLATEGKPKGEVRILPEGAEPKPVEPPMGEVRVNVERINTTDTVKTVIQNLNALDSEKLKASRKPVKHEQTVAGSKQISVEDALSLPAETLTNPERITRLRDIHATAAERLTDAANEVLKGENVKPGELLDTFAVAGELDMRLDVAKRNAGRTLESMNIEAEGARAELPLGEIANLAEKYRGTDIIDETILAQRLTAIRTKAERMQYAKQAGGLMKKGYNALMELYVNTLLGPTSHAANVMGNTMLTLWAPVERAVASVMPGGEIKIGEAAGMVRALPESFVDGLREVKKWWQSGDTTSKVDIVNEPAITAKNFGIENSILARSIDLIGSGVRVNTGMLGAEDALFKGINFRVEVKALSTREAYAEGLKGKDLADRINYIETHIDEFPEIVENANKFKLQQTLQDDMGAFGQWLDKGRQMIAPLKIILPFLKSPNRLVAWTLERVPGVNIPSLVWGKLGREIAAGGASRQLALSKVSTGALATSAIAYYALNGNITGAGPKDRELQRAKRDTGWQPYSLKIGDQYYGYNRLDPFGMMIGMVADATEILGQVPDAGADELGMTLALAFSQNFISKTYMQNLSDTLEAVMDPQANMASYLKGYGRTLVPGVVRAAKREVDPVMREAQTFLDTMRANVPGYSEDLPPRRNLKGDPVLIPPGWGPDWISPVSVSDASNPDPVAVEIDRLKLNLSMPPKTLFGPKPPAVRMEETKVKEGEPLTPQEYDYFVRLAGNELKIDGKGMWDSLGAMIRTPEYKEATDGPEGLKALMIRMTVMKYREAAKMKLLEESPELQSALMEKTRARAMALTGRTQ
jgi:hypothetical protein